MKKIVAFDDLSLADGEEVEAEHQSVPLVLGDRRVELDLSDVHLKELEELTARWFEAGQPVSGAARKAPPPARRRRDGRAPSPYNQGMIDFAEQRGIPYRTKSTGKLYYSAELRARYEQHLRNGGGQ